LQIDKPEIVAEVRAAFTACETAFVANDATTRDALFWDHPAVLRIGPGEVAEGKAAVSAFRRGRDIGYPRLTDIVITRYSDDFATAFCEYEWTGPKPRGKQSRTWLRTPAGSRNCAAHVGLAPVGRAP